MNSTNYPFGAVYVGHAANLEPIGYIDVEREYMGEFRISGFTFQTGKFSGTALALPYGLPGFLEQGLFVGV